MVEGKYRRRRGKRRWRRLYLSASSRSVSCWWRMASRSARSACSERECACSACRERGGGVSSAPRAVSFSAIQVAVSSAARSNSCTCRAPASACDTRHIPSSYNFYHDLQTLLACLGRKIVTKFGQQNHFCYNL